MMQYDVVSYRGGMQVLRCQRKPLHQWDTLTCGSTTITVFEVVSTTLETTDVACDVTSSLVTTET